MGSAYWEWKAPPTCPHRILVSREAWEALEALFRVSAATQDRVGGLLLGSITPAGSGMMVVIEAIASVDETSPEAPDYAPSESKLHAVAAPAGQDCVGWFHTHLDEGVFFSESDQEVHQERFPGLGQVALVCDPLREEAGFFYWTGVGRLGPVDRSEAAGIFHPWKRPSPKLPRRPVESRPVAMLVGILLALGGVALGAYALTPRVTEALERRAPAQVAVSNETFLVTFPEESPYYQITRANERAKRPLTSQATGSVLPIPLDSLAQRGLTGPTRVWFASQPDATLLSSVDLPEVRPSGSWPRPGEWVFHADGLALERGQLPPGAYWIVEEMLLDAWSRHPGEGLPARRLEVREP